MENSELIKLVRVRNFYIEQGEIGENGTTNIIRNTWN